MRRACEQQQRDERCAEEPWRAGSCYSHDWPMEVRIRRVLAKRRAGATACLRRRRDGGLTWRRRLVRRTAAWGSFPFVSLGPQPNLRCQLALELTSNARPVLVALIQKQCVTTLFHLASASTHLETSTLYFFFRQCNADLFRNVAIYYSPAIDYSQSIPSRPLKLEREGILPEVSIQHQERPPYNEGITLRTN